MPLEEFNNGSVDLFLVCCISLSYAAGRVLQRFSGYVAAVAVCGLVMFKGVVETYIKNSEKNPGPRRGLNP